MSNEKEWKTKDSRELHVNPFIYLIILYCIILYYIVIYHTIWSFKLIKMRARSFQMLYKFLSKELSTCYCIVTQLWQNVNSHKLWNNIKDDLQNVTFKMQLTRVTVTFFKIYVHLFHPSAKKKYIAFNVWW